MASILSDTFRDSSAMSSSSSSPSLSPPTRNSSHNLENLGVFSPPKTRTQDVFQSIVKGRKSWKTLRGGEIVWPPELEAALIEGLEQYQPDDSRETRLLGRFPMRNRFISDYIFNKTGKRRTAKQVGSRLQQLRDTCGGKKLLNLLSPCRRQIRTSTSISPELYGSPTYGPPSLRYDTESGSDASSPSTPTTPRDAHATLQSLLYRGIDDRSQAFTPQMVVFIDVLPPTCNDFEAQEYQCAPIDELAWLNQGSRTVRISDRPRRFSEIDPTVTLLARSDTSAYSSFVVYRGNTVVFSEDTPLISVGPAPDHPEARLYSSTLIPNYWNHLALCPDLTAYTIIQRVVQDSQEEATPSLIFSALYKFKYPSTVSKSYPTPSFFEQPPSGQQLGYDYNLNCLSPLDTNDLPGMSSYVDKPLDVYELQALIKDTDWDTLCSPMSPLSQQSGDDGDEDLVSPISICFPEGANYPETL